MTPVPTQTPDELVAMEIAHYYADPLGFVKFAYRWGQPGELENEQGPDANQCHFLKDLGKEVAARAFNGTDPVMPILMTMTSGHGTGKSVMGAWIADWILSTRPDSIGTVTAGTFTQLESRTWSAIQHWTKLCITGHWFNVQARGVYHKLRPRTCPSADSAAEHPGEQMGRIRFDVAALVAAPFAVALPDRPDPIDFSPAGGHAIPNVLRHDAQVLALYAVPVTLGFPEPPLPPGDGVPTSLGPVPGPSPAVLLVLQHPAHRSRRPAAGDTASTAYTFAVQLPDDHLDALAVREVFEEPSNHLGLAGIDDHAVSVRSRATPPVDLHLADRYGAIPVRGLPYAKASRLLAELAAKCLLA